MQAPGIRYVGRCTHCGNKDREVTVHICQWSDGRHTIERLCDACGPTWGTSLKTIGCTLTPDPAPSRPLLHVRL